MRNNMKLGEKIKLLRTEKDMTQPELASKAGIEQSYLSKLENDKGIPSFDIIKRISMALETTGMDLIDSLSQAYVESNLSHIPEVAAEYALIKLKRESTMKKRFIVAAVVVVIGIGMVLVGAGNLLFPERGYNYYSDGVIREGETIMQFNTFVINEINETKEEFEQRLNENSDRFDRVFLLSNKTNEPYFIKDVTGGRRLYKFNTETEINKSENDLILIFGLMLVVTGFFIFLFNIRFKPQ